MLRALDPIKKDNQIFISYVDGTQYRVNRQAELEQAYFFTCNCEKCARDESPYDSYLRSPIPVCVSPKQILLCASDPFDLFDTQIILETC